MGTKLWLSVYFPDWPLEMFFQGTAGIRPLVVAQAGGGAARIVACNKAARRSGLHPGMTVSAAQAQVDCLDVRVRDAEKEQRSAANIAAWAMQFTPVISLAVPQGLLLEVSGSLFLFGGLEGMAACIRKGLEDIGYRVLLASAPTPWAAWLIARAGKERLLTDAREVEAHLRRLPLGILDQPAATVDALDAMGIRTLGDCLGLPRDGVARRFGQELLDELDRALGRLPDPRALFEPPVHFEDALEFPAEVWQADALLFAARRLFVLLEGLLKKHQCGVQHCTLTLCHEHHATTPLTIGLASPTRDVQRMLGVLRERLGQTELPAPVQSMQLAARSIVPLEPRNLSLFPDAEQAAESWQIFLERLTTRLGSEAIQGIGCCADHRPERAWRTVAPGAARELPGGASRPLWLLDPPQRIASKEGRPYWQGPLVLRSGSECIESGWWDGAGIARDYFVAEGRAGCRLWVYQDRRNARAWYLHGIFS